jgi:large subunit ribosomal protein L17
MRHRKSFNHLGRNSSHRKAMLSNMATSLIMHKRINTTLAKAKELRSYVEPLITSSKEDTTHSRRMVFSLLQDKEAVTELFREVSPKVADRPGGYTRIIKMGRRLGDSADMAMIELVDFNELMLSDKGDAKAKKTRRRRSTAKASTAPEAPKAVKEETVVEAAPEPTNEADSSVDDNKDNEIVKE